jgi:hypothetical protein
MKTESYNPSFFFEKEYFIDELRRNAEGESEQYQEFVHEVTEAYADVLDLYRQYCDTYDEVSKRKAWKRFCKGARHLSYALDTAYAILSGEKDNENRTDAG